MGASASDALEVVRAELGDPREWRDRAVVFVPAVEGRDLAWRAFRVARCSYAVHFELLEHAT